MNFRSRKGWVKSRFLTSSNNKLIFSKDLATQNFSNYLNHNGSIVPLKLIFPLVQSFGEATARGLKSAAIGI